ncbi:hypothetical protein [Ferrimonas balearica]|uniref:hypothetical protein n=1 Tax=Ferrimonas balearica TaxID=44012 RepID=UPI001C9A2313|nr:hypothetical protein [Ferrimonas balearica]MBY5991322.1 hypothetical protein [Ferrimonas balearica]
MDTIRKLYFYYPRYLFLAYLGYQLIYVHRSPEYELSLGPALVALAAPMIPVWYMFKYARKMSNDLSGSRLNFINFLAPLIVVSGEIYAFHRIDDPVISFIGATFTGGLLFPMMLCINLTIAMFSIDP